MLMAVPGWPLPTLWTASIASTRAVSIARRSSSVKPSGRVGWGCAGVPVGASVAASAGASAPVLRVPVCCDPMWSVLPRSRAAVTAGSVPGWTSALTVVRRWLRTRSTRGSTESTLVVVKSTAPLASRSAGYSGRVPIPGSKGPPGALLPARLCARGHPVTALSERSAAPAPRSSSAARTRVMAYVALTKPRIIELLLVTTVPAMMLAARGWPTWGLLISTLVGGTLAAGAANVFNCWYDRDIDRLMHRTQRRPLPMGVVSARSALVFGWVLTVLSVALLAVTTTLLAAALAAGAIAYYAVIYTMVLKRHTRHSTLFGGVPGAAPVLIGWAAVTGSLAWPAF